MSFDLDVYCPNMKSIYIYQWPSKSVRKEYCLWSWCKAGALACVLYGIELLSKTCEVGPSSMKFRHSLVRTMHAKTHVIFIFVTVRLTTESRWMGLMQCILLLVIGLIGTTALQAEYRGEVDISSITKTSSQVHVSTTVVISLPQLSLYVFTEMFVSLPPRWIVCMINNSSNFEELH